MNEYVTREQWADEHGGSLHNVHPRQGCLPPCPLHAPSDHHMVDWPLAFNSGRRIFERQCPHEYLHIDPDSRTFMLAVHAGDWSGRHACDGCCTPPAPL